MDCAHLLSPKWHLTSTSYTTGTAAQGTPLLEQHPSVTSKKQKAEEQEPTSLHNQKKVVKKALDAR